jgi:hypothetical protein
MKIGDPKARAKGRRKLIPIREIAPPTPMTASSRPTAVKVRLMKARISSWLPASIQCDTLRSIQTYVRTRKRSALSGLKIGTILRRR